MIAFSCSHCGMKLRVKPQFAGRSSRCPTCKQPLVVPAPGGTQAYVPAGQIEGTPSCLAQAGVQGGVILEPAAAARAGQRPVQELLAQRSQSKQRYIIEQEIARGGMGAVLRAVDCDIRREVAVKYLLDQSDAGKKARFVEEAQITGQLEHPNIVPIHELGLDAQGRLFFTMKMVKGRSLAEVLDELRQYPRTAEKEYFTGRLLNIFVNVCNALAYAHSRGVVHRDLKPANIMIGDFGEVYVMDWGLVKVLNGKGQAAPPPSVSAGSPSKDSSAHQSSKVVTNREEADLTQEGAILGTPVYMPPEQALGNLAAIDARSDIYSLGAILYELLTLQPPVDREGGHVSILLRVTRGEVVAPAERNPQRARAGKIPPELSAVAMKALAKNPPDRYQNVEALRRDIERFQEGRSVSAKQDTVRELLWKLVKRNKAVSAATFVLLPVLLVFLGLTLKNYLAYKEGETELAARTRRAVPALTVAARQVANAGKLKEALEQIDLTLLYEPHYVDAHLLRGQLLIAQKDWAAGRAELAQYLWERPDDADARKLLELCTSGTVDDAVVLFALVEVFQRQNVPGLAVPLLAEIQLTVKARQPVVALYQKQIEANWPGLGGRVGLGSNGQIGLALGNCMQVTTLGALKGMRLDTLSLSGCPITDLMPLQGMKLTALNLAYCGQVKDLSPLQGMPLTTLNLTFCAQVSDLSPLQGVPLTTLNLDYCGPVRDLTPLQGMKLTSLTLAGSQVKDLSPLQGMPLTTLNLPYCFQVRDLTPLRGMKLTSLSLGNTQVKDLAALKGMPLTSLYFDGHQVSDLTPLQGMKLTSLHIALCGQIRDLTPLQGMSLTSIQFVPKNITAGIDVLRQMKSLKTIGTGPGNSFTPKEFWKKYDAGEFKK